MGTTYSLVLYGDNRDRLEAAAEAAFEEARRLDRLLSHYRAQSDVSEINRLAAQRPVKVTPEMFRLLEACLEYSRASEGAFDITVGPLIRLWGFFKGDGRVPGRAEVAPALANVGYRRLRLDAEARTVRFEHPGMALDLGGIGKGYAVDRMIETLRENGISQALLSAGGSSIYGLGSPGAETGGWPVKIRDPRNSSRTAEELRLKDASLSTSGSYEKFFVAEGRVYSHIMDPRTGYPAQGVLAVSVVAPRTIDSEAWTKPFFVLGRQWTARHTPKDMRVYFCEDKAGTLCAWLQ
ncbi:MAG: FAD:protein FMN transferase [Acidobacteria bacterium]|nr:FAD:protein FMN transferase [Acidobacteriota bacterium]